MFWRSMSTTADPKTENARISNHVAPALEAILLVAEDPLPLELLARLVGCSLEEAEQVCSDLAAEYEADGRGFILNRVAGGEKVVESDLLSIVAR